MTVVLSSSFNRCISFIRLSISISMTPEAVETQILKETPGSTPIKITPMPIVIKPIKIETPVINN